MLWFFLGRPTFLLLFIFCFLLRSAFSVLSILYASTALALVLLFQEKLHSEHVTIFAVFHRPEPSNLTTLVSNFQGRAAQKGQFGYLLLLVSSPKYDTDRVLLISVSSFPPQMPQICLCSKAHCKQLFLTGHWKHIFLAEFLLSASVEKNQSILFLLTGLAQRASLCHSKLSAGFHTEDKSTLLDYKTMEITHYPKYISIYVVSWLSSTKSP